MSVTRTFHPVGQGAFYTERFDTWEGKFTIVYDCGSTTLPGKKLATRIRSAFPEGAEIDALFISHFHADHVNGLDILRKHCKIKRVILPELGESEEILLKLLYALDQKGAPKFDLSYDRFKMLVENPASFFGEAETQIITVRPVPRETPPNEGDLPRGNEDFSKENDWSNDKDLSKINGSQVCESGTIFYHSHWEYWCFIPFNYAQDERREQFEKALVEHGLSLSDITSVEKIKEHKKKLVKAYGSIDGDLNVNSLLLYSGPRDRWLRVNRFVSRGQCFFDAYCPRCYHWDAGCLYTGDVDLGLIGLLWDLKRRLHHFFPYLGTIQVPHHGSKHNFDKSILRKSDVRCAIFSFGSDNIYGHPSDFVVEEVVEEGVVPCLVTEDPSSIVVQHIYFIVDYK